jgi:hypothetical protein
VPRSTPGACVDRAAAAYWPGRLPTAVSMPLTLDRYRHEWAWRFGEAEVDSGEPKAARGPRRWGGGLLCYLGAGGLGTAVEPEAVQRRLEHCLASAKSANPANASASLKPRGKIISRKVSAVLDFGRLGYRYA